MSLSSVRVWAPANIAWIKYMGKSDSVAQQAMPAGGNMPANSSLSMTLDALGTETRMERVPSGEKLQWKPESRPGVWIPEWSSSAWIKLELQLDRAWEQGEKIALLAGLPWALERPSIAFSTHNTFPTASGIASSASGMAAFTLAALRIYSGAGDAAWDEAWSRPEIRRAVAALSRQGSGSSCRSFEGPWVRWEGESVESVPGLEGAWAHRVVLIDSNPKKISSSEAHARVKASPLWQGRVERAEARLVRVRESLKLGDRVMLASEVWQESWEMHSLFHTSQPPFTYWAPHTLDVLRWLEPRVGDGACIATMDAGPNIHVTLPEPDAAAWDESFAQAFPGIAVLKDRPGSGVRWKGDA